MTKKSANNSNVPQQSTSTSNSSNSKTKNSSQKANSNLGSHNGNSSTVLNSKHLQNHSHPQKLSHKPRDNENPGLGSSELMKKLSEAVQKQQREKESSGGNNSGTSSNKMEATEKKRSRKGTAPAGVMQNNMTYAGAAFDRAPPATSFPIPSFIKPSSSSSIGNSGGGGGGDTALSQSCPLPTSMEISSNLKTLSISDFFPAADPPKDKKKLDSLTEDLRNLLNLK